jgi:hypothetical protein
MTLFIDPFGKRQICLMRASMCVVSMRLACLRSLTPFSFFGTAMFAEPAVTEVEEVVGLVHLRISDLRSQISRVEMSDRQH